LFDADEIGFVICSKCGARIRADREWCLSCHEPLVAWKKPDILPSWVHAFGGGTLIFGIVAAATVGVLAYLAFEPKVNQLEKRATVSVPATAAAVVTTVQGNPIELVRFVDTTGRGNLDVSDADLAATRSRLEEAVAREPKNADALNSLGLVLERLGLFEPAAARFSAASAIDSRNWIYHFNLAHTSSVQQRWRRAASEYAAVLEAVPGNYAAQYNLAVALHYSSDDPAAISAFQKAIALAPDEPVPHLSLAVSLDAAGRNTDALNEYRRYLQMAPAATNAAAVKSRITSLGLES
jgi:Flp pilus assembly protein TadD